MTTRGELIREIEAALLPAINPIVTSRQSSSDLYEAYLFALIVRAARLEKARVEFRRADGQPAAVFVFRTSPGLIGSSRKDYTFARIDVGSSRGAVEAHLGVRIAGRSQVLHEADVMIVLEAEANRARTGGLAPRSSAVLFLTEAKLHANSLPLGEARGFAGLRADLSTRLCCLACNVGNDEASRFLDHRVRYHEPGLVPDSGAADRFISQVRTVLAQHRRA